MPTTRTWLTKTSDRVAGVAVAVGVAVAARGRGQSGCCQAFQWQGPEEVGGSHIETAGRMQIEDGQIEDGPSWGEPSRDMQIGGMLDWQVNPGETY